MMVARFEQSEAIARGNHAVVTNVEAEWFQLTYNALRIAPDGAEIATYDPVLDVWRYHETNTAFSDVVIHQGGQHDTPAENHAGAGPRQDALDQALRNPEKHPELNETPRLAREFWVADPPVRAHEDWVGLVSEFSGGVVAIGRRDIIAALASLLQSSDH